MHFFSYVHDLLNLFVCIYLKILLTLLPKTYLNKFTFILVFVPFHYFNKDTFPYRYCFTILPPLSA